MHIQGTTFSILGSSSENWGFEPGTTLSKMKPLILGGFLISLCFASPSILPIDESNQGNKARIAYNLAKEVGGYEPNNACKNWEIGKMRKSQHLQKHIKLWLKCANKFANINQLRV